MPRQEPLTAQIARLKAVKQEAIAKKKECAKGLKAAQKKLKKVKSALGQLSDEDLNQAVADRRAAAARVACGKSGGPALKHGRTSLAWKPTESAHSLNRALSVLGSQKITRFRMQSKLRQV